MIIAIKNYIAQFCKTTPVFLLFSIFVILFQMQGASFLPEYVGAVDVNKISIIVLFQIIATVLYFFVIPALTSKIIFKINLKEIGLVFPENTLVTFFLILMALILLLSPIYILMNYPSFKNFYTVQQASVAELTMAMMLLPFYYFAEEFFFRGFLFLGLWKRVRWHSFWITDIIFTLSHIGKPGLEILLCIPASVVFNCLTLCSRSIYPAIIVHTSLGLFCIVLANLR